VTRYSKDGGTKRGNQKGAGRECVWTSAVVAVVDICALEGEGEQGGLCSRTTEADNVHVTLRPRVARHGPVPGVPEM